MFLTHLTCAKDCKGEVDERAVWQDRGSVLGGGLEGASASKGGTDANQQLMATACPS